MHAIKFTVNQALHPSKGTSLIKLFLCYFKSSLKYTNNFW